MHTTRLALTHKSVPTNTIRHVPKCILSPMHTAFCACIHRHRPPQSHNHTQNQMCTQWHTKYVFMHKTCIHTLPPHTISSLYMRVIIYTNTFLTRCEPVGLSTDLCTQTHTQTYTQLKMLENPHGHQHTDLLIYIHARHAHPEAY